MAITHVDDFFAPEHAEMHRAFGFKSSAGSDGTPKTSGIESDAGHDRGPKHVAEPDVAGERGDYAHGGGVHEHPHGHKPVHNEHRHDGATVHHHAHGGHSVHHPDGHVTHHHHDGSEVRHMAHGGEAMHHLHPHGHHITHVEHRSDGAVLHHHEHGGHTVHHPAGHISHHHEDGTPVHLAQGGMPDPYDGLMSNRPTMRHGGEARSDMAQDKALVRKAIGQHENHEHDGEHTDLHLRRGGIAQTATLPRGMRPAAARHHSPVGQASNRAPRNPNLTRTPRNEMAGGEMPYGIEPSAEPDMMGQDQTGVTSMHKGGRARHRG